MRTQVSQNLEKVSWSTLQKSNWKKGKNEKKVPKVQGVLHKIPVVAGDKSTKSTKGFWELWELWAPRGPRLVRGVVMEEVGWVRSNMARDYPSCIISRFTEI